MKALKIVLLGFTAAILFVCYAAPGALAVVPAPAWSVQALAAPTNFRPGDSSGFDRYEAFITNSGGEVTNRTPITIVDTLPAGISVKKIELLTPQDLSADIAPSVCKSETRGETSIVSCTLEEVPLLNAPEPATLYPDSHLLLIVDVEVSAGASGQLLNHVAVSGGGAGEASATGHNQATVEEKAPAGFQEFHAALTDAAGNPVTDAASHPYEYATSFGVNLDPTPTNGSFVSSHGDLRDVEVALPPGLIGNPTAVTRCTAQQFNEPVDIQVGKETALANACPDSSAVGVLNIEQEEGAGFVNSIEPIYDLVPPVGMPAQLGFKATGYPFHIDTRLRSGGDYGVSAFVEGITEAKRVTAARVTIWGTPASSSHDRLRGLCVFTHKECAAGLSSEVPFFRLPSSCASPLTTTISFDTWLEPGTWVSDASSQEAPVGCAVPPFEPSIEAQPTNSVADSPTGLNVDLHVPQPQDPERPAEADPRNARVVLPTGMSLNPSSADGLASCSETQIGYLPGRSAEVGHPQFTAEPAECPDASKIGTVEVITPLLDHPLEGAVYLASQEENPFNSLLAFYIVLEDEQTGIVVKLPAKVTPDPVTGQLTTTVQESPQVPVEDFKFDFFEGARAPLRTPATCGSFSTSTLLTPWTAPEGANATPSDAFQVTSAPGGGSCPSTPAGESNTPSFEAGTTAPTAGAYSPLVVHLNREDGSQNFSRLNVTLPPGATGKLAGIPQCSEALVAQAQARSHPDEGALEQSSPSCPSSSAIGTVTVGAGAGPDPFYVTGKAYLAGPYEGAPFSAVFITPALAGPFDLGTVVVRAGLFVNPNTAQVTTKSDPLPTILDGIPIDVRSITVTVDRSQFILNPTNCTQLTVTGEEISTLGQTAPLSSRFQVGSCQNLKFTPQFTVSTTGKTSKANGASLSVKVAYPTGSLGSQSNLGRVDLQLPKQLPARLSTLQKACTEAQFNTNPAGCPTASMIGTAKAITPLLSSPLTGPAILVSHGGAAFPDVEFLLQGESVMVVLDGETQIKKGITYSHFKTIPDQPITTFEATFPQGPYSVLATNLPASAKNSLCGQNLILPTTLTAQDGAVINQTTKATITGCAKTKTLTRAQKLALALKACHKQHNHAKRKACERQARKKYGPVKARKKR